MNPATAMCSASDHARFFPQRSCSKKISALAAMGVERLRHDADVANARLFYRVHHRGKGPKRNVLIGADENRLMLGIANLLLQLGRDLINVYRIVSEKHALLFVDADHQA